MTESRYLGIGKKDFGAFGRGDEGSASGVGEVKIKIYYYLTMVSIWGIMAYMDEIVSTKRGFRKEIVSENEIMQMEKCP